MPGRLIAPLPGGLLKTTCIAGIFLLIITGGALTFSMLMGRSSAHPEPVAAFDRLLFEFDREFSRIASNTGQETEKIEKLEKTLDQMEAKAISAESLLSVLKRRRLLAQYHPRYIEAYRLAAERVRQTYPYSPGVAAVAAAALVQGRAISPETEQALRDCLPNLSGHGMEALRLSLHVLLGDLQNPQKAAAALGGWFSSSAVPQLPAEREAMIINAALLNVLLNNKGPNSAAAEMDELLAGYYLNSTESMPSVPSSRALEFAANYFYDFDDPLTAAELFAHIPTESALIRQADALWLAGYPDGARSIWKILASEQTGYRERALYNLALLESEPDAAQGYLRTLASLPRNGENPSREFGVIRYSRFLNPAQAAALLQTEIAATGSGTPPQNQRYAAPAINALLELELLRRRRELWHGDRITGAAWLLLGRFPDEENLYQWVNWYFTYQRNYSESALLIKNGARQNFHFPLSEAVLRIHESDYDAAERILFPLASGENPSWEAQANLARLLEARRAPARAVEYYERAAASVSNTTDASRIQFRIAQCLKSLGRSSDVKRALEYALDLNPDNINARMELSRIQ